MTYIGNVLCWVTRLLGVWLGYRHLQSAASPMPYESAWVFWLNVALGIASPIAIWWLGGNIRLFSKILSTKPRLEIPRSGWRLAAFVFSSALLVGAILALILVEPPGAPDVLGQ